MMEQACNYLSKPPTLLLANKTSLVTYRMASPYSVLATKGCTYIKKSLLILLI